MRADHRMQSLQVVFSEGIREIHKGSAMATCQDCFSFH
jgi:hypothetical protein